MKEITVDPGKEVRREGPIVLLFSGTPRHEPQFHSSGIVAAREVTVGRYDHNADNEHHYVRIPSSTFIDGSQGRGFYWNHNLYTHIGVEEADKVPAGLPVADASGALPNNKNRPQFFLAVDSVLDNSMITGYHGLTKAGQPGFQVAENLDELLASDPVLNLMRAFNIGEQYFRDNFGPFYK